MVRLVALLCVSLGLGACSLVGVRDNTPESTSEVVARVDGKVEVRRYGARLAAETTAQGADDWEASSDAFRVLARFIFGDNRQQAEIAMTVPVQVEATSTPGGLTMRFFMPAGFTRATLPEATDPRIRIVEVPPGTLAVLTYTGIPGQNSAAAHEAELADIIAGSAWRATGPPVALYYDPPWTIPLLRRNEVAMPVEARKGS